MSVYTADARNLDFRFSLADKTRMTTTALRWTKFTAVQLLFVGSFCAFAAEVPPAMNDTSKAFQNFIKARAAELRAHDQPPASLAKWEQQRTRLRQNLLKAWGGFPQTPCALAPKKLGEIQRDGYRIEKLIFQTRPGIWMTANAYVPDRPGKLPALLAVHGHWPGAKQDPVVQARCIGPAKLGFFVLAVDAFGAGERGVGRELGEYHGEMVAATLFPVGRPLSGLQVYENMRAVDYLLTRPEVDPERLGITGASGGGNQTMYAGGWDDRFKAVVPVCSVGNYQAYLSAACCMCEVVPGALRFTEEWGVLGLTAPRALMVVSATRDAFQFSIPESQKSLRLAAPIFQLYGQPDHIRQAIFESHHDYNRAMREAMYGWLTKHLKGEGDGSPIPEMEIKTEDPEVLRCFPGQTRPEDWMTIPKFAAAEGRQLVAKISEPASFSQWKQQAGTMRQKLESDVLGGLPKLKPVVKDWAFTTGRSATIEPEPGIELNISQDDKAFTKPPRVAVFIDFEGETKTTDNGLAGKFSAAGWSIVNLDLRATGSRAHAGDKIGRAPDHNTAEWSLWLGRPLLGQWVQDVRAALAVMAKEQGWPKDVTLVGVGPAGVVALCAAALEPRITRVVTVGTLASYLSEEPYVGQRLGIMAPGIVRDVGDVQHLAALIAPRRLVIAGGVTGGGKLLDASALQEQFQFTRRIYSLSRADAALTILGSTGPEEIVGSLDQRR